jgi:hypothetical protein
MLRRYLLLAGLLLLLSACASRWEHSTKRTSEFYADDQACQVASGGASRALEPGLERTSYESCMWDKGWRKKKGVWFFDPTAY